MNAGPISHATACTPARTITVAAAPTRMIIARGMLPGRERAPFEDERAAGTAGVAAGVVISGR
ncbi:hypothetical protein GCM10023320_01440 [Pseudonocardia adelaidensis]|uniref:Uncharacterized protein n=1 Tax=Pseudonocardia adelaidensis TaxID=648754 RepID=A0ABP9N9K5_9PSEU